MGAKVKGWMGAAMWVEGDSLVIRRPPSGRTEVPLHMVEGFAFTNAAIGQKGYRVIVKGGSLQQSRVTSAVRVSDDPYLMPLKPGSKNKAECEKFGRRVLAERDRATTTVQQQGPAERVPAGAGEAVGADRLRELAALRDEGVITGEDFDEAKRRFLAG